MKILFYLIASTRLLAFVDVDAVSAEQLESLLAVANSNIFHERVSAHAAVIAFLAER